MEIFENERIDEIGFGDLRLIQKPEEFCYGVDAVILAHFASFGSKTYLPSKKNIRVMDLGSGTGIIPLILSFKTVWNDIWGLEVQKDSYDRCIRNLEMNKEHLLGENGRQRLSFINGDVSDFESWGKEFKGTFDIVTSNPPYFESGKGLINDNSPKHIARHETTADLEDFIRVSAELLKPKGELYMVHRPSRLVDLLYLGRKHKLEPKQIRFVAPKEGEEPNIVLIQFVKGAGKELKILDTLNVHEGDGSYTEELLECYK